MKGTFLYWALGFALSVVLLLITVVVYQSLSAPPYFERVVARTELAPAPWVTPVAFPPPGALPVGWSSASLTAEPGGVPVPDRSQRYLDLLLDSLASARTREPQQVRAALEELQRLDAPDPRIYRWLGAIYHREGSYGAAATAFERTVQLAPDHPTDLFNLATIYLLQTRYPRAIETFNRILPLQPPFLDDVYAYLGYCLMAMGEVPEARRAWQVSLQLDPGNAVARRYMRPEVVSVPPIPGADLTPLRPTEGPTATAVDSAVAAADLP